MVVSSVAFSVCRSGGATETTISWTAWPTVSVIFRPTSLNAFTMTFCLKNRTKAVRMNFDVIATRW